jgi:hypothetical protein
VSGKEEENKAENREKGKRDVEVCFTRAYTRTLAPCDQPINARWDAEVGTCPPPMYASLLLYPNSSLIMTKIDAYCQLHTMIDGNAACFTHLPQEERCYPYRIFGSVFLRVLFLCVQLYTTNIWHSTCGELRTN